MKRKKMVIIGANGSAYKRTIPALKDSKLCEVVAIQSRNEEKLKKICEEYSIKNYYIHIEELLEKEEYDLIYIANPPFMHKDTILQCISFKKPIICEKPLARNSEEAREIKNLLDKHLIPFMVAHHLRHQKAFLDIKKILETREIGEVVQVFGKWGFSINPDAPSSLWKLNKNLGGGGTLSDNGIHVVDFMLALFGKPNHVIGHSRIEPFCETFSNETMVMLYPDKDVVVQSSHNIPTLGNHLFIYGTEGYIEVNDAFSEKSIKQIIVKTKTEEYIKNEKEENLYKNEVENFIKYYLYQDESAIRGTTMEEAIDSLQLIDEIRKNRN